MYEKKPFGAPTCSKIFKYDNYVKCTWNEEKKFGGTIFCTLIYFDGFQVEYWTRVISIGFQIQCIEDRRCI